MPKTKPVELKPIEFRQLCALTKSVLLAEPTMDDAEWKARVLATLAKWGFAPPGPDQLPMAMTQVEQAIKQTLGPRPIRYAPVPETGTTPKPEPPREGRTKTPAGWAIVVTLMAKLQGGNASAPSSAPPGPRETLPVSEESALDEFWWATCRAGANKLHLLKALAEIAIVRPAGWDEAAVRAEAQDHRLATNECFVCKGAASVLHHIIQIQHGGSNYLRNRVALCDGCHSEVHPWLPAQPRSSRLGGWTHISGIRVPLDTEPRKPSRDVA